MSEENDSMIKACAKLMCENENYLVDFLRLYCKEQDRLTSEQVHTDAEGVTENGNVQIQRR